MISENFSTHVPSPLSTLQWKGLHSAKFRGGRFHQNHPKDELDTLMVASKSTESHSQGKKQFRSQIPKHPSQDFRPSLKTFESKYKKSTVFDEEHITKLIKVPFIDESSSTVKKEVKAEFNGKYNFSSIGKSKIKALQNGMKQTGIYRQFYNSQAKSSSVIHSYK